MTKARKAPTAATELRDLRDRIVRLEEEKKALGADIKAVYAEAKSSGFDVKALRRIVKDSMMDQTQRAAQRETESISDLYRASLGMLDGTPLGDAARRRFDEDREEERPSKQAAEEPVGEADEAGESEAAPAEEEESAEQARARGREDHAIGKSILENPYAAADDRRADWDEGWCSAAGSDGMDVPDAWRRRRDGGEQPGREA